eukprot:scaffold55630_cov27-Cyclotella_meneghiniana.AAC.1
MMTIQSIVSYITDAVHHYQIRHDISNNQLMFAIVVTVIICVIGSTFLRPERDVKKKDAADDLSTKNSTPTEQTNLNDGKLRNVFSVKQRPPITASDNKTSSSDRPFGSSYYYAHNNSKGGYADGLRAEDYVMNGPKLLSKGGVRIDDDIAASDANISDDSVAANAKELQQKETEKRPQNTTVSKPITRYIWDDDGGDTAKIHIDSLPLSSTQTISWEDASITKDNVDAQLIGDKNDGLMIRITTQDDKKYHLHIVKMYGSADSVKTIVKKHKLLVKIAKKKIRKRQNGGGFWSSLFGQKEEYVSVKWPQLSYMTGSEIDEKAFKEVDFKDLDSEGIGEW